MKATTMWCGLAVVGLAAGMAAADPTTINGVVVQTRVFNDFGNSTLNVTNNFPASVQIQEGPFGVPTSQTPFANKHRARLSNDGGATPYAFQNQEGWDMRVDFRLAADANGNPKEGALEILVPLVNNDDPQNPIPYVDEGRFLVKSNGEVAIFGGTMPFHSFGFSYTPGTTVELRMIYTPGDGVINSGQQATIQYGFNGQLSPVYMWGDSRTDGFTDGTNLAYVLQNSPIGGLGMNQTVVGEWSNFRIVPAPGAAALLGLAGLVGLRRRR